MQKNTFLFVILALVAGFVGGFWLANSINRSAMNTVGSQKILTNSNTSQSKNDLDLTNDEIKAKIAEGDKNPTNFAFQKELGIALYTYAVMKKDAGLFPEAVRILERANALNAKDFDVLVALGNAYFDLGFVEKNTAEFQKARETYSKALDLKPGNADVQTDLGISYFVQQPPDYDRASVELQKVLDKNPKHERSLQFLVQIFVKQNKLSDAEKAFAKLKTINASNQAIPGLTSLISDAQSGVSR